MPSAQNIDCLVIGGGFYGCCLALFLRSVCRSVTLVEARDQLLTRASRVNQARVHTGFHYPRSALTAVKSMVLHQRFAADFPEAVHDRFEMLYAIARNHSKVSAGRFHRMFAQMGAPIAPADAAQSALFEPRMVEQAFHCTEVAFDYSALQRTLGNQIDRHDIDVCLGARVTGLLEGPDDVQVELSDGQLLRAKRVFNVTYSQVNHVLDLAGLPRASLKHELAEVALIAPPRELGRFGITVMDGPFFSTMPYPSTDHYSLTHVRYTPHASWTDEAQDARVRHDTFDQPRASRAAYMIRDAARYIPSLARAEIRDALFEVKTILVKNESDDGRPILYQKRPQTSRIVSILGGKIDNIYDLYDLVRREDPTLASAHDGFVVARPELVHQ